MIPALVSPGPGQFLSIFLLSNLLVYGSPLGKTMGRSGSFFSFSINQQIFSGQLQSTQSVPGPLRKFCRFKRMYTEQQRKPSTEGKGNLQNELEKVFANSVSDKGLIFTIYKEYIQLNSEKTSNLIKKWAEEINRPFPKEVQMTNRSMKRSSTSLNVREMEIKTPRYHFISVTMSSKRQVIKSIDEDVEKGSPELVEIKRVQPLQKTAWRILEQLKIELP